MPQLVRIPLLPNCSKRRKVLIFRWNFCFILKRSRNSHWCEHIFKYFIMYFNENNMIFYLKICSHQWEFLERLRIKQKFHLKIKTFLRFEQLGNRGILTSCGTCWSQFLSKCSNSQMMVDDQSKSSYFGQSSLKSTTMSNFDCRKCWAVLP